MTAQFSEHLIYQGKELTLCTQPLGPFLEFSGSTLKFEATCTALWRGYVGTWAIENDRLYLVKLSGNVVTDGQEQEVGLEALFPGYPDGVFAHWFTGELRCPRGALLASPSFPMTAGRLPLGRHPNDPEADQQLCHRSKASLNRSIQNETWGAGRLAGCSPGSNLTQWSQQLGCDRSADPTPQNSQCLRLSDD